MKRLCVFCGSKVGTDPIYADVARQLGEKLVQKKIGLVFGGGHIGMMGVIADAVLARGGEVIGVIPRALQDRELAHNGLTELHIVDTMHQRKALMADLSDGFAALPGGLGTGDELFEILTWAQLDIHHKPVGLLNIKNYFDGMLAWLDHMVEEGFLRSRYRDMLFVATCSDQLIEVLVPRMFPEAPPPHDADNR